MVEAGADEIPEEVLLEALEIAHAEIIKICEAQEELAREVGKPKWLDLELTGELEQQHGDTIRERIAERGPARGRRDRRGAARRARRAALDGVHRGRHRPPDAGPREPEPDPRAACGSRPSRAGTRAVRGRAARAHRGRAGLEGAQVGQAPAALRPDHRDRRAAVPGRPATVEGDEPAVKDSLTKQFVKKAAEAIYKELVRRKIAVEKRRPDGRGAGGDPPDHVRGRRLAAHARIGRSSRAARRRS